MTSTASLSSRWQSYRSGPLGDDVVAAVIVTILLVPQSLAYAMLAGLPPVVGVMASLLPIVAYALLGSSSTLAVGPVAVLSMMTAQAILPVAQAQGVAPHLAALVLALEIAAVYLIAVVLRLEVLAALLGAPVLHGFITGASIAIALGQLPSLLGVAVKGNTLTEMIASASKAATLMPQGTTALIGLGALLLLWLSRKYGTKAGKALGLSPRGAQMAARMAPMLVVVFALVLIASTPVWSHGVSLAGRIDLKDGLQTPSLLDAPMGVWTALMAPATLLGLVGYVESLAVAEALGSKRGEKISPRRELLGLAGANAVAGVTGGMPVTGGFSRSVVNFDAGARTRAAGIWTALFLGIAVFLLGDVLRFLPKAVLAATIIIAVLSLIDLHPFQQAWRFAKTEFALMSAVTLLTVVSGVEEALLVGVLVSVALLLQRTARPHWAEVGRVAGTETFRNVRRFEVETQPEILSIRIDESLLFTNSRWVAEELNDQVQKRSGLKHVVLMMSGVNDIDLTGLDGLIQLDKDLQLQGITLHLSEVKGPVRDRLHAVGLDEWLSGDLFNTQHEAHAALAGAR
ncbi:MAG: SulP family inorganic anion transporter [Leptothrix ochracea]|uniref:SulP family inorganic anion transporter n=1 Tax=Leptothrix ochracea TaxID=735331 RepID=UPI0034E1B382